MVRDIRNSVKLSILILISIFIVLYFGLHYFSQGSPLNATLYVVNYHSNTVSVINSSRNSVVATINVGMEPESVQLSIDKKWLYVANFGSNTVSVINTSSNKVVGNVSVGVQPISIAVDPNGRYIYVLNLNESIKPTGGEIGKSTISVINTTTNLITKTISFNLSSPSLRVESMVIASDGSGLYLGGDYEVVNNTAPFYNEAIWVVSLQSNSTPILITPQLMEAGGSGVLLVPSNSGKYIYGTYGQSPGFFLINTKNNVISQIDFRTRNEYIFSLAMSPDDRYLYASDYYMGQGHFAASFDILNLSDNSTKNINLNSIGQITAVTDNLVYVTDYYGSSVILFNTSSGSVVSRVGVGSEPVSTTLKHS